MGRAVNHQNIIDCYDFMRVVANAGIFDLTEGIYLDRNTDYNLAQSLQRNYLLDQVGCKHGSRILDIGCGNGTLLEDAIKRGASVVGINISPSQVDRCKKKGLDVRLINYLEIPYKLNEKFDGVIANGSAEHFVQPLDVLEGRQNDIYREMFKIVYDTLDNNSDSRKFATTIIHFNDFRTPNPSILFSNPFKYPLGSDEFHFSQVLRNLGGYYPVKGQLERAAEGYFTLEREVDGTRDYDLTSEHWRNEMIKGFTRKPSVMIDLLSTFIRKPVYTLKILSTSIIFGSWGWQFIPDKNGQTPTKLYRHTWKAV